MRILQSQGCRKAMKLSAAIIGTAAGIATIIGVAMQIRHSPSQPLLENGPDHRVRNDLQLAIDEWIPAQIAASNEASRFMRTLFSGGDNGWPRAPAQPKTWDEAYPLGDTTYLINQIDAAAEKLEQVRRAANGEARTAIQDLASRMLQWRSAANDMAAEHVSFRIKSAPPYESSDPPFRRWMHGEVDNLHKWSISNYQHPHAQSITFITANGRPMDPFIELRDAVLDELTGAVISTGDNALVEQLYFDLEADQTVSLDPYPLTAMLHLSELNGEEYGQIFINGKGMPAHSPEILVVSDSNAVFNIRVLDIRYNTRTATISVRRADPHAPKGETQ